MGGGARDASEKRGLDAGQCVQISKKCGIYEGALFLGSFRSTEVSGQRVIIYIIKYYIIGENT